MFVLIPIIIVAGLFIVFSFAPFLWRRPMWGPRPRMMYRPLVAPSSADAPSPSTLVNEVYLHFTGDNPDHIIGRKYRKRNE